MDEFLLNCMQKCVVVATGIFLIVIIPAVLAFIFALFVAYFAFADVEERLDYYYGFPRAHRIEVPPA